MHNPNHAREQVERTHVGYVLCRSSELAEWLAQRISQEYRKSNGYAVRAAVQPRLDSVEPL